MHLLDLYRLDDLITDYHDIRHELALFSELLESKEEIIVFSKGDLLDDEMKDHIVSEFQSLYPDKIYFIISAATGQGIDELKDYLVENIVPNTSPQSSPSQGVPSHSLGQTQEVATVDGERKIYDLKDT